MVVDITGNIETNQTDSNHTPLSREISPAMVMGSFDEVAADKYTIGATSA